MSTSTNPWQDYAGLEPGSEIICPTIQLFVEGVQIPFSSLNIIEQRNTLPVMHAEVPASGSFMKVSRAYQPKVHLFVDGELCFNGFMVTASYAASVGSPPNATSRFEAVHKFQHLAELSMNFCNATDTGNYSDAVTNVTYGMWSADGLAVEAFTGLGLGGVPVSSTSPSGSINAVPAFAQSLVTGRWLGFPGSIVTLWNMLKRSVYMATTVSTAKNYYQAMRDIYIPLTEQGLQFFLTLSGHDFLEGLDTGVQKCNGTKTQVPSTFVGLINGADTSAKVLTKLKLMFSYNQEITSFWTLINQLMDMGDYEMQVFAKPSLPGALAGPDATSQNLPIETAVHPHLPFYYPPQCNVVYPNQLMDFSLEFDDYSTPTQLIGYVPLPTSSGSQMTMSFSSYIRSPQALRKAMSVASNNASLADLMEKSFGAASLFEYGQGVRPFIFEIPEWLWLLYNTLMPKNNTTPSNLSPSATAAGFQNSSYFTAMSAMWEQLYPNDNGVGSGTSAASGNDPLNPFDSVAWNGAKNTESWQSLGTLTALCDYEYASKYMDSRTATATTTLSFNYAVSYPIMVVDPSPDGLPFMGLLDSASHTITPQYVSTTLNIRKVYTLEELGRYYIPPLQPYLAYALGFTGKPTIVNNLVAFQNAVKFYQSVLGTGAVAPEHLYDFTTQQVWDGGQQSMVQAMAQQHRPGLSITQAQNLYGVTFITEEMQRNPGAKTSSVNIYKNPTNPNVPLYTFGESEHLAYNIPTPGSAPPCHVTEPTVAPSV
jgi:hypothetical protein